MKQIDNFAKGSTSKITSVKLCKEDLTDLPILQNICSGNAKPYSDIKQLFLS